jgi:sulfite reductase beta subunit-like hemoprotein
LNDGLTGGFKGDNFLLIRFHGMYQQDDRDIRAERAEQKLEPRHAMLLRCRLPGGVITTKQWQAIDKFAGENTIYGSIRLTNRQTFQFHGILKKNVKPVHQMLHSVGLDALATANDMNRNVLCTSNPYESSCMPKRMSGRRRSLSICCRVPAPMRRFGSIRKKSPPRTKNRSSARPICRVSSKPRS